jgi:glyoxylase-like metal-dependent hydrolase (beta-lactamase superfamily II)
LKGYLDLDLNWKVVDESVVDFAQGIFLHHFPGHTEGLMGLQINRGCMSCTLLSLADVNRA